MSKITNRYGCFLKVAFASFGFFWLNSAQAQITPDQTLPENSKVTRQGNTNLIEGGTTAGSNLFHSFKEFGVPTGSEAHFNNATDIQNILTRVTGGSISEIDGLIKVNGTANLFLINPSGIVFGENARLDIKGSFVTTTADSIKFADDIEFSATNPQDKPLLTVNLPLGLQYGQNPGGITVRGTGRITVRGTGRRIRRIITVRGNGDSERETVEVFDPQSGLNVLDSKTLALLGGDILLEGAVLKASSGRIELGSVSSEGTVSIQPVENGFAFGFNELENENLGDIILSNTFVNASGDGAGVINFTGKKFTIKDNPVISLTELLPDPAGILLELPKNSVDASQKFDKSCSPRTRANNRFVYTGRGGLPVSPTEPLQEFELITSWVNLPSLTTHRRQDKLPVAPVAKKKRKIIEAQKIVVDQNGDTFLVAESPQTYNPAIVSCNL